RMVETDGSRSKFRVPDKKPREIYYANHIDSNIYSFYADLLGKKYEKAIKKAGIDHCVLAYRRIPVDPSNEKSRNRCNVDFADDVFRYIRAQQPIDLVAITFDVKSFFDTLDHKVRNQQWRHVLEHNSNLPDDHYNVFRNITKFSYVYEKQWFRVFKDRMLVVRSPYIIEQKEISKKR